MRDHLQKLISSILEKLSIDIPDGFVIDIEHPKVESHGDYSTNVAMKLAPIVKKSPMEIGSTIVNELSVNELTSCGMAKANLKKPGFINFYLSNEFFIKEIQSIIDKDEKYGDSSLGEKQKVLIEYSDPNTNKPLHIGHAFVDFIGMSISNIFQKASFDVTRFQIVNDRGMHICKSMLMYKKFGNGETPESIGMKPDHFVGKYYTLFEKENAKCKIQPACLPSARLREAGRGGRKSKLQSKIQNSKKQEEPTELENEVHEMLRKWEEGDKEVRELWKKMNGWVYEGLEKTYQREGTLFEDKFYESNIYKRGKEIVLKYLDEGKFVNDASQKNDVGEMPVVADLEAFKMGKKVLLRSNGTALYITQDLALGEELFKKYEPHQVLYVVGADQKLHFERLFKIYEIIGYPFAKYSKHLANGMVRLESGKMSSRHGNVVTADDFEEEAIKKAREELVLRKADVEDVDHAASVIGMGAIKYAMLKNDFRLNQVFSWKKALSFEGDAGPYIQYTYARLRGILRKVKVKSKKLKVAAVPEQTSVNGEAVESLKLSKLNEAELNILRHIYKFPEIVEISASAYSPHHIAVFVNELCQRVNSFYNEVPVLSEKDETVRNFRLQICKSSSIVIRESLRLLNIEVLERM